MTPDTDASHLVHAEYADLRALADRTATHRLHSITPDDPEAAVRDALHLPDDRPLLDVGCGTGSFLHALLPRHTGRLVGLDTSPQAVEATRTDRIQAIEGSAEELPFSEGEFAIVTARHMLYHVPNPQLALEQAHRVLRPGGVFVATVNHRQVAQNTLDLVRTIVQEAGITPAPAPVNSVTSDNLPAMVTATFGTADTMRFDNTLALPTAEALTTYAAALMSFAGLTPGHPATAQIREEISERARRWFTNNPGRRWEDPKGYSLVTATRSSR
ncbi:class I SAM-dependent methyltransferase [Kitasatospora sp. LaBMicrA B282]|uniref:class I SAM-dependent methyltransferase n=1 Tax=Kitasatospora sp. LaBMicrA B282 TaxID=3420949 RepID=UPI003D097190